MKKFIKGRFGVRSQRAVAQTFHYDRGSVIIMQQKPLCKGDMLP
jgi:hypothetical protein